MRRPLVTTPIGVGRARRAALAENIDHSRRAGRADGAQMPAEPAPARPAKPPAAKPAMSQSPHPTKRGWGRRDSR
jgi:hypothetical protein